MDIRAFNTKDLVYHFVLFCNLSRKDLMPYSMGAPIEPGENALLTYCYIDRMAGLSYEVICKACVLPDGRISLGKRSTTTGMKIREGGLISDARVFAEGRNLEMYQSVADRIKENYGYHIDMIRNLESKRFSNKRHVCYPDDVMICLIGMNNKMEQIWVTDVDIDECPDSIRKLKVTKIIHHTQNGEEILEFAGAGRLINQPYDASFGYDNGDIVPIYAISGENGEEEPIGLARNMIPNQKM